MPTLPRDPRELHDQIIDHELVGLSVEKLLALLIIEVRRLRVDIRLHLHQPREDRSEPMVG